MPSLSLLIMFGGRNDFSNNSVDKAVLSDVWLLKLHNFEYQEVKIGGICSSSGRYGHSSVVFGT